MSPITIIYSLTIGLAAIVLGLAAPRLVGRERSRAKQMQYIRQMTQLLLSDTATDHIRAHNRSERMALARAIYLIASHCYDCNWEAIRRVAEANRLEQLLVSRLRYTRGVSRATLLMLLSAIPQSETSARVVAKYMHCADNDIRIAALTATLAANPSMAIRTLSQVEYSLTPFDIARIIALLRRGLLPIAYEPLLADANPNLKRLGMAIVSSFGIEIAERRLHNIISTEQDPSLIRQAIYTLCSLGRSLSHTRIRERLAAMPTSERKRFCRHLSREGYSLASVRNIFSERECHYAETLINSYKRALVRHSL